MRRWRQSMAVNNARPMPNDSVPTMANCINGLSRKKTAPRTSSAAAAFPGSLDSAVSAPSPASPGRRDQQYADSKKGKQGVGILLETEPTGVHRSHDDAGNGEHDAAKDRHSLKASRTSIRA